MRERWFIALAVVAIAAAACGGGGGGGSTSPGSSIVPGSTPTSASSPAVAAAPTSAATVLPAGYVVSKVSITYKPTGTSSNSRRAQTVGAGTNSIAFTLLEQDGVDASAATPQVFGLTPTSPGCSETNGSVTCVLNVAAPVAASGTSLDVFLAQTYTGTSGAGTGSSLTGSGAVALTVAQNSTNTASLSLTGQVASVYVTSSSCYLGLEPDYSCSYVGGDDSVARRIGSGVRRVAQVTQPGFVSSFRVFVIALDSAQNTILNPSTYDTPISLELIYIDNSYSGYPAFSPVPDVSLTATYSSSIDPGGCGGSSTAVASYSNIFVCSPSDVITASLLNVPGGTIGATIIGSVGPAPYIPSPAPSAYPSPFPSSTPLGVSYLVFPVTVSATPTPGPSATPSPTATGLTWSSVSYDHRFASAYPGYYNASLDFTTLTDPAAYLEVTASGGYTGNVTFTADSTCTANLSATPAFGTSNAPSGGVYTITLAPYMVSAAFANCLVTATEDGQPSVTAPLDVSANNYGITIQSRGRSR